ncbi:hypothetical protein DFH06DRAFT_1016533 [Mycena polygramma]|nr:hypothetical protein DFH06DRAFT_1016533 [Mycena polygramma]
MPCPGLTAAYDEKVGAYLERSNAGGGGAHAIGHYSEKLFKDDFQNLSQRQQELAYAAQQHDHTWRNDVTRGIMASFATGTTACLKNVEVDANVADSPSPCESCLLLFTSRAYQRVLNKPLPETKNLRHVPRKYQNAHAGQLYAKFKGLEALFSEVHTCLLAQHVLNGNFKNDTLFNGILQAKVLAKDREMKGLGKQNFKHNEDVDAVFSLIYAISPRAYREISKHIPLRTERSIK